jgi:GTP-binding protein Era
MKSGFVSLVGRPNTGKSTLLNEILETKLAITSPKAGTTRNIIEGVYEDSDAQIVFVDTPGIHKPMNKFGNILNKKAYGSSENVDVILFLVDIEAGFGRGDEFILEKIKNLDLPIFLILNKVDKVKKDTLLSTIQTLSEKYPFKEIFPLSALKGDNVKSLIETLKKYMPNEGKIFEDDTFTNITTNFYVSEIVREKVLLKTREEVPHSVTCLVESLENKKDKVIIQVLIIVDRLSVKKIIVGKNASMLKEIGMDARKDLEEYFNKKVYLSLFVKVVDNWKEEEKYLKEFGILEGE